MISAVRSEIAAAWVQSFDPAAVPDNRSNRVERQDPIGAAIEKKELLPLIDGKAAGVGDAAVVAEGAERPTAAIEG
jgi:hypothetical protein